MLDIIRNVLAFPIAFCMVLFFVLPVENFFKSEWSRHQSEKAQADRKAEYDKNMKGAYIVFIISTLSLIGTFVYELLTT